jgi:hypothetical protein
VYHFDIYVKHKLYNLLLNVDICCLYDLGNILNKRIWFSDTFICYNEKHLFFVIHLFAFIILLRLLSDHSYRMIKEQLCSIFVL